MKKYITISLLILLFVISGNIALADENAQSGQSSPSANTQSNDFSSHDTTHNQSNNITQPSYSEPQKSDTAQSSTEHGQGHGTSDKNSTDHSTHDGQAQNQNSEPHDGGHGAKEVKEVNIKPWVYAFLAYTAGVLLLALILKKGSGQNNELVS